MSQVPQDAPLWIKTLISNAGALDDFNQTLDKEIEQCNNDYRKCKDWEEHCSVTGKVTAYDTLKRKVNGFTMEEKKNARFRS